MCKNILNLELVSQVQNMLCWYLHVHIFTTKCFAIILDLYIVFFTSKYMCTFLQTGFRGRRCCYKEILSRRPKRRSSLNIWTLKGQCHEIFYLFQVFTNHLPPVPCLSRLSLVLNFLENFQRNYHSCVPLNIWETDNFEENLTATCDHLQYRCQGPV